MLTYVPHLFVWLNYTFYDLFQQRRRLMVALKALKIGIVISSPELSSQFQMFDMNGLLDIHTWRYHRYFELGNEILLHLPYSLFLYQASTCTQFPQLKLTWYFSLLTSKLHQSQIPSWSLSKLLYSLASSNHYSQYTFSWSLVISCLDDCNDCGDLPASRLIPLESTFSTVTGDKYLKYKPNPSTPLLKILGSPSIIL